ncbi:MAG: NADPH-dependent glutamate synthase [Proteobacteria bacterium]|nr:NADPH-dependent glutamate synthase [Pseudomonadota bacterium]
MIPHRTPMPEQAPDVRNGNFEEVTLGYSESQALLEAGRCLQCKKPGCVSGCPVEIDIPGFIARLCEKDVAGAYAALRKTTNLPAVCGRVCPQETQCEGACILGKKYEPVAIGRLERYVADTFAASDACEQLTGAAECHMEREVRVACIGAGPSSLTCAGTLAAMGVKVTVFEALHEAGGVLVYGIPEFRLPKAIVRREIEAMKALGVEFKLNWVGGKTITIQDLQEEGYDAIFIGVGAGLPRFMNVPGENLLGVFSANEYLTRVNLGRAYNFPEYDTPMSRPKQVCVIGGGNVAMDAARTAKRLGADVTILYRRTEAEMPARLEEVHHAKEEGVKIKCLCGPVSFNGDENKRLTSVTVQEMCLGEPDASGRCSPVCVEGAVGEVPTEMVIIAVGTRPNPILLEATPDMDLTKWGYIATDESGETSIPGVFAGGDIVTGSATVISAMGAGRRAAQAIAGKLF